MGMRWDEDGVGTGMTMMMDGKERVAHRPTTHRISVENTDAARHKTPRVRDKPQASDKSVHRSLNPLNSIIRPRTMPH
jgi:hypothetical protein